MIDFDRQQLINICQTHNIRKLYLFGSASRAEQRPDSEMTDDGIILRYRNDELIGLTILDASTREAFAI